MEKKHPHPAWTVDDVVKLIGKIEFPEFQREYSIWKLDKKQRLIDSVLRDFDIASIYLHKRKDGGLDCIDGQQRLNALWFYLGINDKDEDNGFNLKITNEIGDDDGKRFDAVDEKRFKFLPKKWQEKIKNYQLNIVLLSDVDDDEEQLNLQFLRLQLGAALRAGEKLKAMTGKMRDEIFEQFPSIGYFNKIRIQQPRYGRQEVAAQIVLNAFSRKESGQFHRSRYLDLQEFFKRKESFKANDTNLISEIKSNLLAIEKSFVDKLKYIRNKALAVSVYLFCSELIDRKKTTDLEKFAEFVLALLKTLKWQLPLGIDMFKGYRDLLGFQANISQGSVEKGAIKKRHEFLEENFQLFKNEHLIKGDTEYKDEEEGDPDSERAKVKL